MAYANSRELKEDILFRGGESLSQSDWSVKVLDYLNRCYRAVCTGASEYLPEYVEDWWWMRSSGVLLLEPIRIVGTAAVLQGSVSITFSDPPAASVAGWRFKVDGHPEVFKIGAHTAGQPNATLDAAYTGADGALSSYKLMKTEYSLASSAQSLMTPMIGYRDNPRIVGLSPERMDDLFPLAELQPGTPTAFALESPMVVRFSHGGRTDGQSMRVEYRYKPAVDDLTDSISSIPLIPIEYRHVLADMALAYLWLDKNDDRTNAVALGARMGLAAMLKENRRKLVRLGAESIGHIYPRGGSYADALRGTRPPLRTDSGLIIG